MPLTPLGPDQLRRQCDPDRFTFETTAELAPTASIIGQPRGVRAIEFGIGIRSHGYNIFVLGEAGTGRTTAIRRFLRERTRAQPVPNDWVYVHNFRSPNEPRAIEFRAGRGRQFKERIDALLNELRVAIPSAFNTDAYKDEVERLRERTDVKQQLLLRSLEKRAERDNFGIVTTAAGLAAAPLHDGKIMDEDVYENLPVDAQKSLDRRQARLDEELEETLALIRQQSESLREQLKALDHRVAERAIAYLFDALQNDFAEHAEVQLYLGELHDDVLSNLAEFRQEDSNKQLDLSRYQVNLFVDNGEIEGAPVVVEPDPTYYNLVGRIEFEMRQGIMRTHFTNIKAGSLHRANGGYLIIDAYDLVQHQPAWEALKRAIKEREINLNPVERFSGGNVLAKSSDPEPIPLDVKVILLGRPGLYYQLYDLEEEFDELFKVKADFSVTMPRTAENEHEYACFIAQRCAEEGLPPFDRSGAAQMVEFGSWLADHQDKLSTRFGDIADLVREAGFWATRNGRAVITGEDVLQARRERTYRSNKIEELVDEEIVTGEVTIEVSGKAIGQINALSVLEYGDYMFAHPSRISVQTFVGGDGILLLDRETGMTDRMHNKGTLTLNGFLGARYGSESTLEFSATISYEQNYSYLSGDSASTAQLYALLSSLGKIPLNQGLAVTGSVNQNGAVLPIGAATEKIEGFFRVCRLLGLDGTQGVIIPKANRKNLVLSEEIVAAVAAGQFNIWAIATVDEGLEILTGMDAGELDENGEYPEDSVHGRVADGLLTLARLKRRDDDEDGDEDDEDDVAEDEEDSHGAT